MAGGRRSGDGGPALQYRWWTSLPALPERLPGSLGLASTAGAPKGRQYKLMPPTRSYRLCTDRRGTPTEEIKSISDAIDSNQAFGEPRKASIRAGGAREAALAA